MPAGVNGARLLHSGVGATRLRSADGATALVADHGAHVLSWCPAGGTEALFLSDASRYGATDAIRGGVPIIFPQFGEHGPGRRHGVARVRPWTFDGAAVEDGAAVGRWTLEQAPDDRPAVPREPEDRQDGSAGGDGAPDGWRLAFAVRLAGTWLELHLAIHNISSRSWQCHAALHTYLRVDGLDAAFVDGLQATGYLDQAAGDADGAPRLPAAGAPVAFQAEVDRIYPDAPPHVALCDGRRVMRVTQSGFTDTVVWNPGAAKAAALQDLATGGHRAFVCIEAAAVARPLVLRPGARWHGSQRIDIAPARIAGR